MTIITSKNAKDSSEATDVYPDIIYKESSELSPDFGIKIDDLCKDICEACKGFGTDHKSLIAVISSLTPEQRHKISIRYPELYNKDLLSILKRECGNNDYGLAIQLLSLSPPDAECLMIRRACDGLGTDELLLYPIICGRSNKDMNLLKRTYYKMYTGDLISRVSSEVSGNLQRILISCLQGVENNFDNDYHTEEQALNDAVEFYKRGQGKWFRTEGNKLFKVIAFSPPKYLNMINLAYSEKYGYTLFKALEKNFRGDAKDASLFTLGMKLKPYETVAHLIKKSCKGIGTNELLLTSCIVRYTAILSHVNLAHIELFGKSIHDRVRSECSGNYKKLLMALLNHVIPEGI